MDRPGDTLHNTLDRRVIFLSAIYMRSDLMPLNRFGMRKNYFALREALGTLLSRPIDLVEDGAIRNPYILRNVAEHQQVLYAA